MSEQIRTSVHKLVDALDDNVVAFSTVLQDQEGSTVPVKDIQAWIRKGLENPWTQQFSFDEFLFFPDLIDSVSEAYQAGLVDLPFPSVTFEHHFSDTNERCIYLFQKNGSRVTGTEFRRVRGSREFTWRHLVASLDQLTEFNGSLKYSGHHLAFCPVNFPTLEARSRESSNLWDSLFTLLGALNATGTSLQRISPPQQLNQRRRKRGGSLIRTHTHIVIGERTSGKTDRGGIHASPRFHVRRGHIRELPTGNKTWVRPCVVGDPKNGTNTHDYKIVEVS